MPEGAAGVDIAELEQRVWNELEEVADVVAMNWRDYAVAVSVPDEEDDSLTTTMLVAPIFDGSGGPSLEAVLMGELHLAPEEYEYVAEWDIAEGFIRIVRAILGNRCMVWLEDEVIYVAQEVEQDDE